ncbi:hypothetical protein RJ498_000141 [Pluralibacter gergoviae]
MNRRDLLKGGIALTASGMINLPLPFRIMSEAEAATLLSLSQIGKLWYPGSTDTISNVLQDVKKRFASGGFDGSLIISSIKNNNINGLYNIMETAAVAGVAAVPVVGWVLSAFLSLGFKYLNSTLSSTTDYKDLITSIVNKAIDENNYNLMKGAFAGTTNVYTTYANLIASFQNSPPSSDQHVQLIGKYNDVITSYEQQSPNLLLKDKNGYTYQGLPLFCSLLNIATCASIDILKNKEKLNIDDAFYNQNYQANDKRFYAEHKKIRDTLTDVLKNNAQLSHDFPTEWAKRNSLARGLFLSGLSGLLESFRRRYEAKFFKTIQLRNSIEIYSNSYVTQKTLEQDISADLLKRASVLSKLTGYSHADRVQRIGLGYLDSTEGGKGYYKQYETCSGEVGNGDQKRINVDFNINQFGGSGVGSGDRLPVNITYNATAFATYGIELATSDGKHNILLGQLSGNKDGFYSFGVPGYYLAGLVVNNSNENGKTCAVDSGPSITTVASVHRHWSSLEYVAEFRDANTGIELDTSVFSLEDNTEAAVHGYADYLIGKNIIKYTPAGGKSKLLTFSVYNSTGKSITATPVLFASSSQPLTDYLITVGSNSAKITLSSTKDGGVDTGIRGIDGNLYLDGASTSTLTFPPGKSVLTISSTNKLLTFMFASLLLVPN